MYLHYAMGFGLHKGRQLSRAQLIGFVTAAKYLPDYQIVMHTLPGTYLNAPSNITRNELDEEWTMTWPNFKVTRGEHASDKVRLFMLKEYGGLYNDCDQFFVNTPDFSSLQGEDKLWMGRWSKIVILGDKLQKDNKAKFSNGLAIAMEKLSHIADIGIVELGYEDVQRAGGLVGRIQFALA
jgi:Glycosyltransferase sugar-binding region containing DXD motif/PhoH-like protein